MKDLKKWQRQAIAKEMVDVLISNAFDTYYADDLDEAKKIVLGLIPKDVTIGLGGSVTLEEMGLLDTFKHGQYKLIDRYNQPSWEATVQAYKDGQHADYFVTSTNAITRSGELVNVDCSGNRVSSMIFGPDRVIIVAGVNKVVDTLDDAMKRLKHIAPLNCNRVGHNTPCRETGKCEDCKIQPRMCNYTTIIHHGMKFPGRISIVLIAEDIGF